MGKRSYLLLLALSGLIFTVGGVPLAQAEEKTSPAELKASAAYAEHLFASVCTEAYRKKFRTSVLSETDRAQFFKHTTDACTCQYRSISATNSPTDIVDFIMYTYSYVPKGVDPKMARPNLDPVKIKPISMMMNDKAIRKKCGFIR